jgi:WD40 repeat protein
MANRTPNSPRNRLLPVGPRLWATLAVGVGLWVLGARPAGTAGPPAKGGGKPGPAAPSAREFLIPQGAVTVKGTLKQASSGGVYHILAGGKLLASKHHGTYFVEPGGALQAEGGLQQVVLRKGGKAAVGDGNGSVSLFFYEKGAEIGGVKGPRVAVGYDRITFRAFQRFTLRAVVADARGRPAAGVKVHAFGGLTRDHLGTATSAADGTVTFRPKEGVAALAADFGSRWVYPPPPGTAIDLDDRQHLSPLNGWEVAIVQGSWCRDGTVLLAHPAEGPLRVRELRRFPGPSWGSGLLTFSADGRLLASERDRGQVTVWDLTTGGELATVGGFKKSLAAIALAPDGKTVAAAGVDEAVHVWRTAGGKRLHTLRGHQGEATCLLFGPDGRSLLSGGWDGTVRTWDLATGKERSRFKAHPLGVQCLAFSPDGKTLATGGDIANTDGMVTVHVADLVRLWDPATGRELRSFAGERGSHAFSPDGRLLAWGGVAGIVLREPGRVTTTAEYLFGLRDLTSGGEMLRKVGIGDRVAFTPDGRVLVTAGRREARFWEVATGQEIVRVPIPFPAWKVGEPALGPRGRQLAAVVRESTIHVWDLSWEGLYGHRAPPGPAAWGRAWQDLAGASAAAAYEGVWALAAGGDKAVAFLGERLKPAPPRQLPLERLLADLSSPRFAVREAASRELKKLGAPAEAALRAALVKQPPLETRVRIEAVLAALARQALSPEELRQLRAVQALERVGTPAARRVLESLAAGWPVARQTREARAALTRLPGRPAKSP